MNARIALMWPARPVDIRTSSPAPDTLHVWAVTTESSSWPELDLARLLDASESARAQRLKASGHTRRFVIAHGLVRVLLASYLRCAAAEIAYEYSAHGKPALSSSMQSLLRFNVAHAGELLLVVVTTAIDVGIDVERATMIPEIDAIVDSHFSAVEQRAFWHNGDVDARRAFFYRVWTRKEAYLKARGKGLSASLTAFSVWPIAPWTGGPTRVCDSHEYPEDWSVLDLPAPAIECVAAVAAPGDSWRIKVACWADPIASIRAMIRRTRLRS